MELKLKKHPNSSNSVSGGLTGLGIIKEQKIINKYNKIITVVKFLIFYFFNKVITIPIKI